MWPPVLSDKNSQASRPAQACRILPPPTVNAMKLKKVRSGKDSSSKLDPVSHIFSLVQCTDSLTLTELLMCPASYCSELWQRK